MSRRVGAWKLRAVVYGLLLAVALLVAAQRGLFDGRPARAPVLTGHTSQGSSIEMTVAGVRVAGFDVDRIWAECGSGPYSIRWYPSTAQGNVTYHHRGGDFVVNEHPDSRFPHPPGMTVTSTMTGHVAISGESVTGVISWVGRTATDTCRSGPVPFSVSRAHP